MKVPSDLLKAYKGLHTWTGIVAGVVLFIGFWAGALTMFKEPLDRWVSAGAVSAMPPTVLDDRLLPEVLTRHAVAAEEIRVNLQPAEHRPAPIGWVQGAEGHGVELGGTHWWAGRDATGQLQVHTQAASPLGEWVDLLHRTAGVPGHLGDDYLGVYVMGVAAVLYFLALVSGVVVLLPTLVKDFFAVRPGANRKRFWLDVHNVLGITSLPFHLVISLTVVVFAFHDQFYGALEQVVYGRQPMFTPPAAQAPERDPARLMPLSQVLARVQQEAPGFAPTELLYMRLNSPRPMVRVALAHPNAIVHGPRTAYLVLQPYTGQVLNDSMLPGRESTWSAPVNLFFALHFGSYGGEWVRWLYAVLGLMGAALFYTGNLLWLETRRKRQRADIPTVSQPRASRVMAVLTVGGCLGSVLGVGVALIAGKWGRDTTLEATALYLSSYYLTWGLCLVWTALRGVGRAAPELLGACAVVSLGVSASSVLVDGAAAWRAWQAGSAAPLTVDALALLAALAWAWAAMRTRQRVAQAGPDTLWARPMRAAVPSSS
jgi:uncharacterized iron-regulated membrane protein